MIHRYKNIWSKSLYFFETHSKKPKFCRTRELIYEINKNYWKRVFFDKNYLVSYLRTYTYFYKTFVIVNLKKRSILSKKNIKLKNVILNLNNKSATSSKRIDYLKKLCKKNKNKI